MQKKHMYCQLKFTINYISWSESLVSARANNWVDLNWSLQSFISKYDKFILWCREKTIEIDK